MIDNQNQFKMPAVLSLMLVLMLSLTACSSTEAAEEIREIQWQWVGLVETEPAAQSVVPNPESFTLFLDAEGSMSLQVDCNSASGSYLLDGYSLSIEVGMSTLAYCGDDSLDQAFLTMLSTVESYALENGTLFLNLADGSRMLFEKDAN